MSKIIPATRAFLRKTWKSHEKVDATASGPRFSIPLRIGDEPQETRRGLNEESREPFYEMKADKLFGYYHGYAGSYERRTELLYADLFSFYSDEILPISRRSININSVRISFSSIPYRLPPSLKYHSETSIDFFIKLKKIKWDFENNEWENNTSIRLEEFSEDGTFYCEPVRYFDQVATNLTVDWASGKLPNRATTIRSEIERPQNGLLPPLSQSLLANNLGTAIMFYNRDLTRTLVRLRSDNLASIAQKALHCTVSGVLEMPPGCKAGEHKFDFFLYGTRQEIKMETNLDPDQYLLFPICIARELPRAGKPQLFFVAINLIDDDEFERECRNAKEKNEYLPSEKVTLIEDLSQSKFSPPDMYTYEGWASQILAENFLIANESIIRERLSHR
ncbi:hypothetical protein [Martelella radicis]|uniref:Uncharacterized protein n=1 Tax=Martelella radicis TaxID=1397476 RepID=A0A7W6KMF6_9HYPH|nr:hypothetical protein [Martelella radicis]MBB4123946.1 hypothetical protein [Martelella radicis]